MSDKYCCVTYQDLSEELKCAKLSEIDSIVQKQGLPKSVFASVLKVLGSMHLYCPVCGSGLTEETKDKIPPRKALTPVKHIASPTVSSPLSQVVCPQCKGVQGAVKCMSCLGKGKIKVQPSIDPQRLAEIEEAKEHGVVPYSKELEEKQMKELEEDV